MTATHTTSTSASTGGSTGAGRTPAPRRGGRPGHAPASRRRLRRLRRRAVSFVGLVWLRATFVVLRAVAPRVADRRALDVWCTLPPGARHRRLDARPRPGDVVRLPAHRGGGEVVAEVWGAGPADGAPVVYLVHGWGGWRGQLGAFVDPFLAAGYRVVALDAPGHGDADAGFMGAHRGTVTEMIEALEEAVRTFGEPAGVVAHSLGTTVAMAALRDGVPADRLVLIAPNPAFAELLDRFAAVLWLGDRAKAHLRGELEEITGRPIDDFDVIPAGADGGMPDALVVHDLADRETPHAVGAAVVESWPNATLLTTDGLGHYRVLADPEVVRAAVAHVVR